MRAAVLFFCAVALFALAGPARGATNPPPTFDQIVESFRAQLIVDAELKRENVRLRAENRKLHKHLSGYGRWVRSLQRTLRYDATVNEAIDLASTVYNVPSSTLWRKARCESHLYPGAKNRHSTASGLFQFLFPSTWRSTPFGPFSVWSPYANAMAAGWMHANGRAGEWACK